MTALLSSLIKDESGVTAIEYGLLAALIAVACMSAWLSLGNQIVDTFNAIATTLMNAVS